VGARSGKTQLPDPAHPDHRLRWPNSSAPSAGYEMALEAALRPWLDAIVVQDEAGAAALLPSSNAQAAGSARLLSWMAGPPAAPAVSGATC
jgi:chromosome segregation ATPase